MTISAINPFTGNKIQEYEEMSTDAVESHIFKAQGAFNIWKTFSFSQRKECLIRAAHILLEKKGDYGKLITKEMGKTYANAALEIEKSARGCIYYAENAERILSVERLNDESVKSFVTFQPLGIILAVMPWNFPFWQVFRFAAPSLMAGNGCILKHASNVPGCALAIEEVFNEAGFPRGLFKTLLVSVKQVPAIIEHDVVKAVTVTGSTNAGKAIASKAGEMLKKAVLELGGSDPYIVLEDADLENAVEKCIHSRLLNSGQTCISAKRFIVVESIHDDFVQRCLERMKQTVMGDPMDPSTTLAPMSRHDLRDELHQQVTQSIGLGARCLLGGHIPDLPGAFYPATLLTNVTKGMSAYDEEMFGPVASVIKVKDTQRAIAVANDSEYGLGGAIFTSDVSKGIQIASNEIETGGIAVNDYIKSDPRLPFGGIKSSGYGRELSSYGIKEFVNIKTIYID